MKKQYLLAILVVVLLIAGVVVGLVLVQKNQLFKPKASSSNGTATVSIAPASATFERNAANTVSVYFNAASTAISGIAVSLAYSNLSAAASNVTIDPSFLADGNWTCPVKSVSANGSTGNINVACYNSAPAGYSNSSNTLLATFTITATQVPLDNPLKVTFDPVQTIITRKSDATDIALTPSSTGSYTITDSLAGSPTASPIVIVGSPTASPTTNPNATATPTATDTPTAAPTDTPIPTATPFGQTPAPTMQPLPVTGFDTPTIIGVAGGGLLLLISAAALIL